MREEPIAMDLQMSGKVVLVTAASKGLGRACAHALAAEGAHVAVASRDPESIEAAAQQIREETGARVLPLVGDVSKPGTAEELVAQTVEHFGRLDGLVTNAGGPPPGSFQELDDSQWELAFNLTLMSVVRLVRAAIPEMEKVGGGRIVNIASSSIKQPIPNLTLSNVFRPGLQGLFKHLAEELAPKGILVNTVGPGRIATDRLKSLDAVKAQQMGVPVEEISRASQSEIPLGRYGDPAEFAWVVAFLVSAANTYVTGQAILVDGGLVRAI